MGAYLSTIGVDRWPPIVDRDLLLSQIGMEVCSRFKQKGKERRKEWGSYPVCNRKHRISLSIAYSFAVRKERSEERREAFTFIRTEQSNKVILLKIGEVTILLRDPFIFNRKASPIVNSIASLLLQIVSHSHLLFYGGGTKRRSG